MIDLLQSLTQENFQFWGVHHSNQIKEDDMGSFKSCVGKIKSV
jgi:hypothetical protein